MPRVSIVMPVYSGEKYLREALDSIIAQTYTDWELIAVNEYGSSRAATDILREYEARDDRIRVIQNEKRLYIAQSLNVGLRAAKGEYIARMDADDISKPERLRRQVDFLDTNPQIIICGTHIEDLNGEPIDWDIEEDCEQIATDILFFSPFVHPTVMFRRSVVETYEIYYNPKFVASEDYEFFQRVCLVGKAANLPESLFRYRLHADNATEKNRAVGASLYEQAMARGFIKLGISFTAEEMSLLSPHKCLKGAAGQEIIARLSKLLQLLKRMFYVNERKNVYPRKYFSHTLYKRFQDARKSVSWACDSIDWRAVDSFCDCAIFRHPYFFEGKKLLDSEAEKTPLISVLLPAYNSEDYIAETIDSILRQTLDDFEILVINEFGSDDQTVEIIEMFHDDRIKIVQNEERLGLAESLNKGMKMARGKYIARIDADDLSSPDRFEKQVRFLDENPEYGVCGSWQHHFGPDTDMIHRVPVSHEALKAQFLYRCELCHSTLMLRREAFIDNGLFYDPSRAAEDYELWTRAVYCFKFANLPEVLGEYRVGGGNITAQKIDRLSKESGEICASLLRQHLGIHVEAGHIPFLSSWTNEFNKVLNPKTLYSQLLREKKLLEQMWKQNEKRHVYAPEELLYTINKRWRWATNNWVYGTDLGTIYSIEELFVQYPILEDNRRQGAALLWMKNMLHIPKKALKKCLKPFFRPIRVRLEAQIDQLKRQIWDVEGHLKDALQDVKKEVWDSEGHLKDQYHAFGAAVDERITMLQKDIDALRTAVKNAETAAVGMDSRISKVEENLTRAVDSRVWKAEENLTQTVDSRVWKAEENLSKAVDSRVLKAEENILQTVDSRVWKAEENLSKTVDSRVWKAEENLSKAVDSRVWKAEENLSQTVDSRVWKAEENLSKTVDSRVWKAEENIGCVVEEQSKRIHGEHEELHNHIDLSYRDIMVVLEKQLKFIGKHDLILKTEHPLAFDSLDYRYPRGTVNDNTRYPRFIKKCETVFGKERGLSFLDLGCSGGGMVLDAVIRGHLGIGLEGCDLSLIQQRAEWRLLRNNLFTCDITKPFTLTHGGSGETMAFDVITAWEVMEHIQEDDLPQLFDNVRSHLADGGYFVGSIACWDDIDPESGVNWHVTVHPPEWWQAKFREFGFEEASDLFCMEDMARGGINHPLGWLALGGYPNSYLMVLKKARGHK